MPVATAAIKQLRVIWGAIGFGAAMLLVVTGVLQSSGEISPANPEWAQNGFYAVALCSVLGLVAAFAVLRRLESAAYEAESEDEALAAVRSLGITMLGLAEMPTLLACAAAFITGDTLVLALGLPLFGLIWLTWPSDARVGAWIEKSDR